MVPKKIIVLVFVSVVLVIIISSLIYINIIQFLNSNQWAAQTYQVLNQIEIVYSDIKDIETGARGYIITGNDTYLYSYNDIGKILMPDLSTLKNFIIADKSPIRSYTSLEDLINDQLRLQEKLIKLRRSGGYSQNDVLITEEVGKSKMDEIRNAVNGMKSAENDLLTDRLKQRAARTFGLFGVTTILVILLIAAIIFTIYLFKKELGSRRKVYDRLQEDITERIKAEVQLKLAEEKLKKYAAELETLNETKDKLFSIIAHDLRSPFQALTSASDLLIEDLDSFNKEEIQQIAGELKTVVKTQNEVVDNLLTWAQLQRGKIEPNPRRVFLYDKVKKITEQVQRLADGKNIQICNSLSKDLIAMGDMEMLQIIFHNLIFNGIKFCNHGGEIEINGKKTEEEITIWVRDNGIGMDDDLKKLIFTIDKRIKRSGTMDEKGTGLGLILSKEMVEKQGGKIWAESEEGKGSTFYFTLPAASELEEV